MSDSFYYVNGGRLGLVTFFCDNAYGPANNSCAGKMGLDVTRLLEWGIKVRGRKKAILSGLIAKFLLDQPPFFT